MKKIFIYLLICFLFGFQVCNQTLNFHLASYLPVYMLALFYWMFCSSKSISILFACFLIFTDDILNQSGIGTGCFAFCSCYYIIRKFYYGVSTGAVGFNFSGNNFQNQQAFLIFYVCFILIKTFNMWLVGIEFNLIKRAFVTIITMTLATPFCFILFKKLDTALNKPFRVNL